MAIQVLRNIVCLVNHDVREFKSLQNVPCSPYILILQRCAFLDHRIVDPLRQEKLVNAVKYQCHFHRFSVIYHNLEKLNQGQVIRSQLNYQVTSTMH